AQLAGVLHHVRRLAAHEGTDDAELLARFEASRDEAAFEALVCRHGPMVLRVCQRMLRDPHAAEDAFQATFLVLARRAASARAYASAAGWLHGVAHNVALRARRDAVRRREHERRARKMRTIDTAPKRSGELEALLNEELTRLPEEYRTPLVLCYLEGK